MSAQEHWDQVYQSKDPLEVSWHQVRPEMSLALIKATGVQHRQRIVDVGGGASVLVDSLLAEGFTDVSVLDISSAALEHAEKRLGHRADKVSWIVADATDFHPSRKYSVWHDRAVFHFLTQATDRQRYVVGLRAALESGGQVIIGTFAPDGPQKCSGLEVRRYDAATLAAELGDDFVLLEEQTEIHVTPWDSEQKFNWFRFVKK